MSKKSLSYRTLPYQNGQDFLDIRYYINSAAGEKFSGLVESILFKYLLETVSTWWNSPAIFPRDPRGKIILYCMSKKS